MGKLPGDSGEGPLLSDGPSPRNMRFTANQAGFHGEGVGVEMRPSPEEGDARSEPGRTGKNRQDGVGLGSVSPGSGVADKRKKTAFLLSFSCTPNRSNIELFSGRSGANLVPAGCHSGSKSDPLKLYDSFPFIHFYCGFFIFHKEVLQIQIYRLPLYRLTI